MLRVLRKLIGCPPPQEKSGGDDLRVDWARASMCLGSSYDEALFNMPPNYRIFHDKNGIHVIGPTVK